MLRVSEFCRGPLSPVPSSGGRGRRRKNPRRSPSEADATGDGDRDGSDGIGDPEIPPRRAGIEEGFDADGRRSSPNTDEEDEGGFDGGGESIRCSVRLHARSGSSPPLPASSSAVARVQLDVLKKLSLRDGDHAYLEKHASVEDGANEATVLQTVVVRLKLMDEDEEEDLRRESLSSSSSSSSHGDLTDGNDRCLVPPVVMANLGIPPQILWEQRNDTAGAPLHVAEDGIGFRLRSIHDDEDLEEGSDDNDDDYYYYEGLARRRRRRRQRIAGLVRLRPLGRPTRWPWFSLRPTRRASAQSQDDNDDDNDDHGRDGRGTRNDNDESSGEERLPVPSDGDPTAAAPAAPAALDEKDDESEDDAWIYPSRAGTVLQEATLCEVRYSITRKKSGRPPKRDPAQEQKVCYYEVLRIEEAGDNKALFSEDDSDDDDDDDDEENECFYVTTNSTQFELDSYPLSSHSNVRRMPLPLPSDGTTRGGNTTATDDDKALHEKQQSLERNEEETNDRSRRLFASPDETGVSPESEASTEDEHSNEQKLCFSVHPDWKRVATALLDAPPADAYHPGGDTGRTHHPDSTLVASRILHIVGTDRAHDLVACVETAASMVGMRSISIRGLAAFGYEQRRSGGAVGGVTVRSPMLEQQLAGIDAAFEHVAKRRMEPCVLHFYDVDEELASVGRDEQLRCQIEERLWAKWTEGVSTRPNRGESWHGRRPGRRPLGGGDADDRISNGPVIRRLDHRYTPRLLVVISTKSPLKKGPWLERLVFPSINLSLPDDDYTRYLWKTTRIKNGFEEDSVGANKSESLSAVLTSAMMRLLRGRPVHEIVWLKKELSFELGASIGEEDHDSSSSSGGTSNSKDGAVQLPNDGSSQHLERLCKHLDAGRRNASSDVARISAVSWDDVGGLDHVRAEILDAIELPLKHPHLFPPGTGRSGILLFGPPGTGKTLVAKAVATECGLPFLSVKGPELLGSYVGESEANIRKVFSSAKRAAESNLPVQASILFFDELDSLAPKRGASNHGGGVMERVVASLLSELDGGGGGNRRTGNEPSGRVFVLGATNRPDLLDPSLLRPGRLDRLVYLGIPADDRERARVLASQLRKMKLEGDALDMAGAVVGNLPPRLSGADMSKLSGGAMLRAIERLCRRADRERDERQSEEDARSASTKGAASRRITVDEVLESWGDEKCTPVITLDDLTVASRDVSPSVTEEELRRYERLRAEHENASVKDSARSKGNDALD